MSKKRKAPMQEVVVQLIDAVGPTSTSGYIEGKNQLKEALAEILDEPEEVAKVLSSLEAEGHVRFVNRVGRSDAGEAHWRLVKNPVSR